MKKIEIFILLFAFCIVNSAFSQNTYDVKYTVEYVLKDYRGNEINRLKLYRNGDKLKFTTTANKGKDNEQTTDIYVFKNEGKVYTATITKNFKTGNRHSLDMSFIGMQTGVYILDLGNDGSVFNTNARSGTGNVLGYECTLYNLLTSPDGGSTFYMYQDNLTLKHFAQTTTSGTTLEAVSFDNSADVPESIFTLPSDITFLDY